MNFNMNASIQSPMVEMARRAAVEGVSLHQAIQMSNDLKAAARVGIADRLVEEAGLSLKDSYDISLAMSQEVADLFMYDNQPLDGRREMYRSRFTAIKAWRDRVNEDRLTDAVIEAAMVY